MNQRLYSVLAVRRMKIRRLERGAPAVRNFARINFGLKISRNAAVDLWEDYGPRAMEFRELERKALR